VTYLLADIGGRVQAAQQTFGAVAENHPAYSLDPQRRVREGDIFSRLLTGIGAQVRAAQHIFGASEARPWGPTAVEEAVDMGDDRSLASPQLYASDPRE